VKVVRVPQPLGPLGNAKTTATDLLGQKSARGSAKSSFSAEASEEERSVGTWMWWREKVRWDRCLL
jgi:hypothetical protein